ncbi:DUF3850 domain-containing protein [Caballeronia sp. LZ035]|uniref:DUF3850 domain-containing protein n=1 Tax=Caballeronia sp. LZ035 TaxID=3038568 RepID=UPI002860A908|nr:DUF3850 domain-containing protein [Caballeronia sp. LZ035]MDR5756980.1 DUF3850 domain-containing protein [Caballeronia sp. LZ035]
MTDFTHELKTDHEPFSAILSGEKTHEIRCADRDFKVGDMLRLKETRYTAIEMSSESRPLEYTGRTTERVITHIQSGYGLPDGIVVMSLSSVLATESGEAVYDEAIAPQAECAPREAQSVKRDAIYRKALAMGDTPDTIGPDTHEHHFEVEPASGIAFCTYCGMSRVAAGASERADAYPIASADDVRVPQVATVLKDVIDTFLLWNGQASAGLDVEWLAALRNEAAAIAANRASEEGGSK